MRVSTRLFAAALVAVAWPALADEAAPDSVKTQEPIYNIIGSASSDYYMPRAYVPLSPVAPFMALPGAIWLQPPGPVIVLDAEELLFQRQSDTHEATG
jgi:hypothetical protein